MHGCERVHSKANRVAERTLRTAHLLVDDESRRGGRRHSVVLLEVVCKDICFSNGVLESGLHHTDLVGPLHAGNLMPCLQTG